MEKRNMGHRRFVPPEWPMNWEHAWVKFEDDKHWAHGHTPREDGAFCLLFRRHYADGYPQFRLEDGWYMAWDEDGTAHQGSPQIKWMEV